ncbi:MAG: tripartite tricarboxylate transporter substrate binding protein [Treponemataceae bacterium]|nr:MAG: tripartite tricarboxylate transporter substrate binding protein [Treponemataceae bacterium]
MKKAKSLCTGGIVLLCIAGFIACGKKEYPAKQISLIIQAAPGGESDSTGRLVAQEMEKVLGVPIVASNKTGASGSVAFQYVVAQKPDGYTIGICPAEVAMVEPLGISKVNPGQMDFLGQACETASSVIVRKNAPYNTLAEFIQYCKERPGEIRNGTSGAGSTLHVGGEVFAQSAGIKFRYVPFDGSGPAVTALMGGHVDVVTIGVQAAAAGLDSGDLKVLAILGNERVPSLPDVPTAKEQGIDCVYTTWVGFYAPKGLPEDVKTKLEAAVQAGVDGKGYTDYAVQKGLLKKYRNGTDFTRFVQSEYEMYQSLIPSLNLGAR